MSNSVRDYLLAGIAKEAGVHELEAQLANEREGMYVCGVKAAIKAGSKEVFETAIKKLMNDFRSNARGIADRFNMEQAKDTSGNLKTDDDGSPIYKVPSSLSTVKSVMLAAFDREIDLGSLDKPSSFGAIRTLIKQQREAENAAPEVKPEELKGDDKRRYEARELLTEVADSLDGISGKALTAIVKLIKALAKQVPATADEDNDADGEVEQRKAA